MFSDKYETNKVLEAHILKCDAPWCVEHRDEVLDRIDELAILEAEKKED